MEKLENALIMSIVFVFIAFLFPTLYDSATGANVTSGLQPVFDVVPYIFLLIGVVLPAYYIARRKR